MRFGVLGTGMVGQAIGGKLVELGHEVMMGSRQAGNEKAVAWAESAGARQGSFADAASFGEMVVNATSGGASLEALRMAGEDNLAGKVLIDIANPLTRSDEGGVALSVSNTDSLGEQIQRAFPRTRVVKSLNTINASVMVNPASVSGDHVVFVGGNDAGARAQVTQLLQEMGWPAERIRDLGDITSARATEMYLLLWLRLMGILETSRFNIAIQR